MKTPEEFCEKEFLRFDEGKLREGTTLDNTIFWISTGTLTLSINFIIGLKNVYFIHPLFLVISWVSFLINIIVHIIGFKFSVSYHEKVTNELSSWAENNYKPLPFKYSKRVSMLKKIIYIFNDVSLLFLILGLTFITLFAITNFLYLEKN